MSAILTHPITDVSPECVGFAAFIVGALAHAGCIPLELQDHESRENYALMIRIVARCLVELERTKPGDVPPLPFSY